VAETEVLDSTADTSADLHTEGCGCCQPPPPAPVDEELRRLVDKRAELERRLAAVGSRS